MAQEQKLVCVAVQAGNQRSNTIEAFLDLFIKKDTIVCSTYDPERFVRDYCAERGIVFSDVKNIDKSFDLISYSVVATGDPFSPVLTPTQALIKLTKDNNKLSMVLVV